MKKLYLPLFFAFYIMVLCANDISLKPGKPWKTIAPNEFMIDYDGSRSWPAVLGLLPAVKGGTYLKISWSGKSEHGTPDNFWALQYPSSQKSFQNFWRTGKTYADYVGYVFFPADETPKLRFSMNPGKSGKVFLKNVKCELLSSETLRSNLAIGGDFEGLAGLTFFSTYNAAAPQNGEVVDSPDFFCGEKSFRIAGSQKFDSKFTTTHFPAVPGRTAVLNFWAKTEGTENGGLQIWFDFWPRMSSGGPHFYHPVNAKIGKTWKEYHFEIPVPETSEHKKYPALKDGLCRLVFFWRQENAGASLYLDNIEYVLR